jgi:ABC-type polysaccharide transport system permease subunit
MSVLYLIIKLYPLFGLSMAVLCFDLSRSYRRKANSIWIGFAIFTVLFVVSVAAWLFYRGDLHSERWFADFARQFR